MESKVNLTVVLQGSTKVSPCKQVINMSEKAYKEMLNVPTNPKFNRIISKSKDKPIRVWDSMSEDARIRKYCELIAHDLKGVSFKYVILND